VIGLLGTNAFLSSQTPAPGAEPNLLAQQAERFLLTRKLPFAFSGAVLVALDGNLILDRGFGYADYELRVPNRPDNIFRIGSLTKPITAAATMTLVESRQLSLDDSVCRFVAHCPPAWAAVQIRHLLSHTSGIPDLFNAVPAAPLDATRAAIDKAIQSRSQLDLDSTPGTKYVYRNFNYMLLGYIIEIATGKSWIDVLQSTVFSPAGMTATAYDDVWAIVPQRARGYDVKNDELRNIAYKDHSAYAAGGLRSTTHDLLAFAAALERGAIVQDTTYRQMSTPVLDDYGYGLQIKQYFGERMFNHTGGIDGFASHLAVYPNRHLTIIVLSNVENEPAKLTACNIAAIFLTRDHGVANSCPEH
jgi:CubicO group peptidase (beta-lactamase class C family)